VRRRPRPVALALPALALVAACAPGCASSGSGDAGPGSTTVVAGPPSGPAYDSVADLARVLTDRGLPCTLQYPGLRDDMTDAELSICTVSGDQAFLRVWGRADAITTFLAAPQSRTGTVVVGANWTISLTMADTARSVATALGGIVPAADTPIATSRP
jgi:hypothetical protein